MNADYMLEKITEASGYLVNLNTLISEKWYDKQDQFIENLKGIKYDLLTIQSLIKQEKTKDDMIKRLRNLCNAFNDCQSCPLDKLRKPKCSVSDYSTLCKLKIENVTEMYNCVEEWVKNFTLDD